MVRNHDPLSWIAWARDAVGFAITAGTGAVAWYRKRGARHWPITFGKVEYAMTSDEQGWKTNLSYSYNVDGAFYSGLLPLKARNEAAAEAQADRWKGLNVAVRYSPRHHEISVMRIEDQGSLSSEEFRGH
jgi:hypothetical protein